MCIIPHYADINMYTSVISLGDGGAFEVLNDGTLRVDSVGFKTTGSLVFRNGWIVVAAGSSVTFSE